MMQITEDTPPDMLAGAMDLTVHLPNGKAVKMSVERSTPMMDLLVQITTANQLQLSTHTLQVLGMAPSSEHNDKILPFKPNTPIGTLDTQHIKVLLKGRTLPALKYPAPGHQPFESTFRLKVHLPRNQLYVTRVSRHVLLEDIMKKVCEEKNLDPVKYDFKHPGNLDEVLDPKLTLSDYQITEIYVVAKGTTNLNQAFSAADIMVLRKEEERKQMHNKTGGGVFNLIFKRGKSSMGSGSVSSDNRSISPTHSDDSRSVTPPAVQAPPIVTPPKKDPPPERPERPKPPQRKRRPAPKPPQIQVGEACSNEHEEEKSSSVVSNEVATSKKTIENGLTICHSRNSSDSSGYHEASILSDHCANASLPRARPKSAYVGDLPTLQSSSNLTKMAAHSRSTTSLVAGRKKKAAPPPPPPVAVSPPSSVVVPESEKPSPLVASQSPIVHEFPEVLETNPAPIPKPRSKLSRAISSHRVSYDEDVIIEQVEKEIEEKLGIVDEKKEELNKRIVEDVCNGKLEFQLNTSPELTQDSDYSMEEILTSLEAVKPFIMKTTSPKTTVANLQKSLVNNIFNSDEFLKDSQPPSIVGVIPKTSSNKDSSRSSINEDEISDLDEIMFTKPSSEAFNYQSFGRSVSSASIQGGFSGAEMRKWANHEELDSISLSSYGVRNRWVAGEASDTESITSSSNFTPLDSIPPPPLGTPPITDSTDSGIAADKEKEIEEDFGFCTPPPPPEIFSEPERINNDDKEASIETNRLSDQVILQDQIDSTNKVADAEAVSSKETSVDATASLIIEETVKAASTSTKVLAANPASTSPTKILTASIPTPASEIEATTPAKVSPAAITTPPAIPGVTITTPHPVIEETSPAKVSTAGIITPPAIPGVTIATPHPVIEETTPAKVLTRVDAPPVIIPEVTSPTQVLTATVPPTPPKVSTTTIIQEPTKTSTPTIIEPELSEIDWQYQLPSPPKAFRDSSPSINDTNSIVSDFKDSVVTSPELFEKLKSLEDTYSEAGTLKSEGTSIASEEPLNTLSLEHLEIRKSLVYNRELATSLKMTDSIESSNKSASSLHNQHHNGEFQTKQPPKPVRTSSHTQTLPNFKITTYDVPKQNIKVFEDDTIRSNTLSRNNPNHQSMDNIAFIKKQSEEREYKFYKPKPSQPPSTNVSRSGSFSTDRTLAKPVSRSKSTLTLNKYQPGKRDETNNISRSNSLFDVSGLQSLEVMKLIQNKLNTPPGSAEDINITNNTDAQSHVPQKSQEPEPHPPHIEEPSPEPIKKYYYRGPPAVNMSTWSERPKIPVAVKEDADYKLGNVSSKLIVNTTNNNVTSNNTVEVKQQEQITQKSGNVVIKIGASNNYSKNLAPIGYRKPFSNVNQNNARPHSIALPSDFDISRVPVVRSVEYKKPYKDLNTSITHLNQGNDDFRSLHYFYDKSDSFAEKFKSTENLRSVEKKESEPTRRVFRVGSFKPADTQLQPKPVVRGFKINNDINTHNRLSWNPSTTYNTLPSKPKTIVEKDFGPNQHVPFSQSTLRRTDSNKIYANNNHNIKAPDSSIIKHQVIENNNNNNLYNSLPPNYATKTKVVSPPPPPPPQMPKISIKTNQSNMINNNVDPRDMLLESIRNFGGKRGLKNVKT